MTTYNDLVQEVSRLRDQLATLEDRVSVAHEDVDECHDRLEAIEDRLDDVEDAWAALQRALVPLLGAFDREDDPLVVWEARRRLERLQGALRDVRVAQTQ